MAINLGLTASGVYDGGLNLIGTSLNGVVFIPGVKSGTFTFSATASTPIFDGGLNICGYNNTGIIISATISFIGLTSSVLGPTGPSGTASINSIYDGGLNIIGEFDSVNHRTHIYGLTPSVVF